MFSLSVAKTIATALITSRLDYCISLLYNIASKDILKLQCVQNCLARVVTRSPRFSYSAPRSSSHRFQTLHYCLSNSFFWRIFISIFHVFFSTQTEKLVLGLVPFQLLFLFFGIHSLNKSSNSIVSFRHHLKTHLFRLAYPS